MDKSKKLTKKYKKTSDLKSKLLTINFLKTNFLKTNYISDNYINNSSQTAGKVYRNTAKLFVIAIASVTIVFSSACSTVSITTQEPNQNIIDNRANIITSGNLSNSSISLLRTAGINHRKCILNFDKCLMQLDQSQFLPSAHNTPKQLALFAELEYNRALTSAHQHSCKGKQESKVCQQQFYPHLFQAVKYSYAYLFYNNLMSSDSQKYKAHQKSPLINDLDIQTLDIYNTASRTLIEYLYNNQYKLNVNKNYSNKNYDVFNQQLSLENNQINLLLAKSSYNNNNNKNKKHNRNVTLGKIFPTDSLKTFGLEAVSRRTGFGLTYVTQEEQKLSKANNKQKSNTLNEQIHPASRQLFTAVLKPKGKIISEIITSKEFDLNFYDPYMTKNIDILGTQYPLAADFSASYAIWLSENELDGLSVLNMLRTEKEIPLPHLYMLEPFNPNKRVIIMMHGLASSPKTWVNITNDILNDAKLRDNYQVWQVFYPTNLPILENRYNIQKLLERTYKKYNTNNTKSGENSIIIAHSLGSVISRMMLSDNNLAKNLPVVAQTDIKNSKQYNVIPENLDKKINIESVQGLNQRLLNSYKQDKYQQRFQLKTLKPVDEVVFIASPFRGTNFTDRWFSKALRDIIRLPKTLTKYKNIEVLSKNRLASLFLHNGATQLSDSSAFVELTGNIQINPRIDYHTIVGKYDGVLKVVNAKSSQHKNSDGVVPYASSHLEGAKSEIVIKSDHYVHNNPKTTIQLRKILHQHLKD